MVKMIEVENISFHYGNELIFSKIAFSVNKGDFIAVIGANGTGKSTLLRLLLGEITPVAGSIRLFHQDIRHFNSWPQIGYVPQNGFSSSVTFPATVEEIVKANLFSQIGLFKFPKKQHHDKTMKALELVGMAPYSKRMIGSLSGGQQQRVMLARVLVNSPEVMILDEPTTGVDDKTVKSLYDLLAQLNKETGLTIVMVTHDFSRVSDYVSRILCLEEGSLVELGKAQINEERLHRHKHPVIGSVESVKGDIHHGNSRI